MNKLFNLKREYKSLGQTVVKNTVKISEQVYMKAPPIKVALVISNAGAGGRERSLVRLAAHLDKQQFDASVVCLGPPGPLLDKETARAQVKLCCFNKREGIDLVTLFRLTKFLRAQGFSIVHSNNWGTLLECVVASKLAGVQTVLHTQGGLDYGSGEKISRVKLALRKGIKRICAKMLTCIVTVSNEIQGVVLQDWKAPHNKVRVIHNGVKTKCTGTFDPISRIQHDEWRKDLGFDRQDLIIGSVGYFRPVKGFSTLISAMAQVITKYEKVRLVLLGEGPLQNDLENQVKELSLSPYVRFVGQRNDVEQLLPLMDIFALNSVSEGISNAILEAMAAGLPVIATNVGGNPEVIRHMETGLLVPPSSPIETANALTRLLEDSSERVTMGKRGRQRVEAHFSLEKMVQDYEELFKGSQESLNLNKQRV